MAGFATKDIVNSGTKGILEMEIFCFKKKEIWWFAQYCEQNASGGLGLVIDASIGASYAPADVNNLSAGGFTTVGGQIGLGIEGSPASLINVQANYQYTPIVEPIFKF